MVGKFTAPTTHRTLLTAVAVLVSSLLIQLAVIPVGEARKPIQVMIKRSSVPGSMTVRIKNAIQHPYLSSKALAGKSSSWVSFRSTDLSVKVPRGLAAKITSAAKSGQLSVTTGMGEWGHGLLRLTAGKGKQKVVLQRTRYSIGSEALQVQLGANTKPFWIARASVKKNIGPGKIHGASGVSRGGDVTLLNPLTLKADLKPAKLGELRWFTKPAKRTKLLQPFLTPEQWSKSSLPAALITKNQRHRRSSSRRPVAENKVSTAARKLVDSTGTDRGSSRVAAGKMSPPQFDPTALLARKKLDASKLKFVPAFGNSTSGLRIYYAGESIGYYERDASHRSMRLKEGFHGKGIGTVAYLVMTKLLHDAKRGLLNSDRSAEQAGRGNLSPQAQNVWRRFVKSGFAEAQTSGSHTVYQMKQSAIDSVNWGRFTSFLAPRAP
jgi:hypothetical protein